MEIRLLILTFLFFFFGVKPIFAAIEFNISNPQKNDDEITLDVSISGLTSSSCLNGSCYLQGAFTSPNPIRYFGFTKNNNGQWYEYIRSPGSDYIQSTFFAFEPTNGGWSGQLTIKINPESSNYEGSGEYNLKAWRYSGKSNSYSGDSDNTLSINIESPPPIPTPTPTPTPSPTPSPTPTPTPTKTPSPSPVPKKTVAPTSSPVSAISSTPTPRPTPTLIISKTIRVASVAAASTASSKPSPSVEVKGQKELNLIPWVGSAFILAGIGLLGYIYFKKR